MVSFDVFEHIPDTDGHLEEVKRILKRGGCYLLQTPNKWTNIPFSIIKDRSFTQYKEYHCFLHNYWEIKKRFQKHGFDVEFVRVPLVTDYFRETIKKHFGNVGLFGIRLINPDKMPTFLQTNFYIVARRKASLERRT